MLAPRPSRRHRTIAATLLLAGGAVGCGSSSDDPPSTGGGKVAAGPGKDGPPAKDAAAITAALRRTEATWKTVRTAHVTSSLASMVKPGEKSTASNSDGTLDLPGKRYFLHERIGDGDALTSDTYGEGGRSWTRTTGKLADADEPWEVLTKDDRGSEPLALVRQLGKVEVRDVGDTATIGGKTCRWFDGRIKALDVLSATIDAASIAKLRKDPAKLKLLLGDDGENAAFPVRACIDDRGLSYAVDQDFDAAKVIGGVVGQAGRTVQHYRFSAYGTAKAPVRPVGIDTAKDPGA